MRKSLYSAALALTVATPAFATEVTGYRVAKPAAPCQVNINRMYQDGTGPLHIVLQNVSTSRDLAAGKLTAAVKVGTSLTLDGSNFSFSGTPGQTLNLIISGNPRGAVKGAEVNLTFDCHVSAK